MPDTDINSAAYGNLKNTENNFSVDAVSTDGTGDQKETTWINVNWTSQLGYYKAIPELQAAIDARARWSIGKGYEADPITELVLMITLLAI